VITVILIAFLAIVATYPFVEGVDYGRQRAPPANAERP
jgi:hypothetical protein